MWRLSARTLRHVHAQWQKQFPFWSERTLRRSIKSLEDRHLLIYDFFNRTPFDKTKWYSIDYDNVDALKTPSPPSGQIGHLDKAKEPPSDRAFWTNELDNLATSLCIPETTTETTIYSREKSLDGIKEAVQVWNSCLQQSITLTKNRERNLQKTFLLCFDENISKWKEFLKKILESDFLMGRVTSFKISFDWAIKEDHVYRILEGAYTKEKASEKGVDLEMEKEKFINSIEDKLWKEICLKVNEKYGPGVIWAWFKELKWERKNNTCIIRASTDFKRDWIKTHYYEKMKEFLVSAGGGEVLKLEII